MYMYVLKELRNRYHQLENQKSYLDCMYSYVANRNNVAGKDI